MNDEIQVHIERYVQKYADGADKPGDGKTKVSMLISRNRQQHEDGRYSCEYLTTEGWIRVKEMDTIPGFLTFPDENVTINDFGPKNNDR